MRVQRIGLYGGSFDPVHLGHRLVAQAALEELALDRLFFIPAAQSPFKGNSPVASAASRLALLRLALAGERRCAVDDQEIARGGVSYSVDTVRAFATRFPNARLFWLIGADHVSLLPQWREAAELARLAEFVVIPRPQTADGAAPLVAAGPPGFRLHRLRGFPFGVSSSEIRERVRAGLPVELLTGPVVAEAIRNNRLYL